MGIPLRTEEEIVKLREACKLASDVLVMIEPYVKEGVTTGELDRICHDYMAWYVSTVATAWELNSTANLKYYTIMLMMVV